jgi:hypothetical protein
MNGTSRAAWFETALAGLLTMRIKDYRLMMTSESAAAFSSLLPLWEKVPERSGGG